MKMFRFIQEINLYGSGEEGRLGECLLAQIYLEFYHI
jgi:hypothetical protein